MPPYPMTRRSRDTERAMRRTITAWGGNLLR
jgi:hypothetical protein